VTWPLAPLPELAFDVILADPPWHFTTYGEAGQGKAPSAQYATMDADAIKALPVSRLGRGDCLLMLWACWPSLPQAFETMDAWGFRYVTGGSWHKRTKHGKTNFGTGYVMRSATEPFLIGTLGSPLTARNIRNIIDAEGLAEIDAENRGHSRKPDEQYDLCEAICPRALRFVELFSRQSRPGWTAWGNEVGKFDQAVAA
jgi:N6-adenosine-specific RNA methylase IME4